MSSWMRKRLLLVNHLEDWRSAYLFGHGVNFITKQEASAILVDPDGSGGCTADIDGRLEVCKLVSSEVFFVRTERKKHEQAHPHQYGKLNRLGAADHPEETFEPSGASGLLGLISPEEGVDYQSEGGRKGRTRERVYVLCGLSLPYDIALCFSCFLVEKVWP